jgi:diguanylate cyclase (GGDEF)-like protein
MKSRKHSQINLENFPDSPYAHELARDHGPWPFGPALEAEYVGMHLERVRLRIKAWFALNLLLAVIFSFVLSRQYGLRDAETLLHIGVLVPICLVLAWLPWSRSYQRFYLPATRALVPIFNVLIAVFSARAISMGQNEQVANVALNMMAVFLISGLLYREASLAAGAMLVAFIIALFAFETAGADVVKCLLTVTLTAGISALVQHDVAKSHRKSFLEGALIGELAARDGLSGLMNRRTFDEHLLRVWQHALRDRRSVAVLLIDIDHFKAYNDSFGHQAGDVALRSVASVIEQYARRPLDLAARFGGEEFAVIYYDLAVTHVSDMAERIRVAIEGLSAAPESRTAPPHASSMPLRPITVSIGVGMVLPTMGRTPHGAVQLADEALYAAKNAGRNRVLVKGTEEYELLTTGTFATLRTSGKSS